VPQGAIAFLQGTPTSPSDPIGTLGLKLVYFPLANIVVSPGGGESLPREESQLYIPAWLPVQLPSQPLSFPLLSYLPLFGDLYNESLRPL
jgi:hypothetical protein